MKTIAKFFFVFVIGMLAFVQTASAANRHVWLLNNSPFTIFKFYASNVSHGGWEEDILGSNALPSGGAFRINIDDNTGACLFDVKIVFSNGLDTITEGVNVCAQFSMFAMGTSGLSNGDRHVWILNSAGKNVYRFYASNTSYHEWGADLLGSKVIPGNLGIRANIDDGTGACFFDMRAEFTDGSTAMIRSLNVCEKLYWNITN